jgi:RNA polymerase sigma factor (sigma-70 family)
MVLGVSRRLLQDAAMADDAAQETFLRLASSTTTGIHSIGGWLHRVAHDSAIDILRREDAQRSLRTAAVTSGADDLRQETLASIRRALADMPAGERDPLVRHFINGDRQAVLARHLGCSQPTVSRRIEHALAALRIAIESQSLQDSMSMMAAGMTRSHQRTIELPQSASSPLEPIVNQPASEVSPFSVSAIRIFVDDLSRAEAFYGQVLGTSLAYGSSSSGYLGYDLGAITLIVEAADPHCEEDRALIGRFAGLSFASANVDQDYALLSARGVVFTHPPEKQSWGGVLAHFKDPSGNILTLAGPPASPA